VKNLSSPARLIVAADFEPDFRGAGGVERDVLQLADSLADTGVCLKVNSALRACGYGLIRKIQSRGLKVFADLKLNDIPNTMKTDGALLALYSPDIVTVMASSGVDGMRALKSVLPSAEVLAVTVLTSLDYKQCAKIFNRSVEAVVLSSAELARQSGLNGLVASALELRTLRIAFPEEVWPDMTISTPGIRPKWAVVAGDDQSRTMTPSEAISTGATRIVVGRPITQSKDPKAAVLRTIEEIASAI
jgi:orotidine-5'-phosphate decarboxylase